MDRTLLAIARHAMPVRSQAPAEDIERNALAITYGGIVEYRLQNGTRIDLLSSRFIAEVKRSTEYLKGIRQLLDYQHAFPQHQLWLHIYDRGVSPRRRRRILSGARMRAIERVTFADDMPWHVTASSSASVADGYTRLIGKEFF